MTDLLTEPNLPDADGFYERLVEAHRGLSDAASRRMNAKLILLLANHIGDAGVLDQALKIARADTGGPSRTP